jgi:hypothetical protein
VVERRTHRVRRFAIDTRLEFAEDPVEVISSLVRPGWP